MLAISRPRLRSITFLAFLACTGSVLGQWQQNAKLLPADAFAGAEFGNAVALSGEWLAAGAHFDGAAGYKAGAVYMFVQSESGWYEEAKLTASDAAARAEFGSAVDLSDDMLAVGAPGSNAACGGAGAAYVFYRDPNGWVEGTQLTASDAQWYDRFGSAVAADSDWLLVGAPYEDTMGRDAGAAYLYHYDGAVWVEQAKLLGSSLAGGDGFGASVALEGNVAIVGAPRNGTGAAYVFRYDGSDWVEESVLLASDGSTDDRFGASVALCDGLALLGAPRYDSPAGLNAGAAYVFRFGDTDWIESARLTASDADPADYFGVSVAMCAGRAVVGADFDDVVDVNSGSAYVYRLESTRWVEEDKLAAQDGALFGMLGAAVAVDAERVVAGALRDDDAGDNSGSAYVFALEPQNEPPICDAGPDHTVECEGGPVSVVLDGTGSYDPDEDALTYHWTSDCPNASWDDPDSATAVLTLHTPSGCLTECNVTLTVGDGVNPPVSCDTAVTIVDSAPPVLTCPDEADVYPGDSNLPDIPFVEDCDPNVQLSYRDSEALSECAADPVLKIVTRTWTATDECGNTATCTQTITVWKLVLPLDVKPGDCRNSHSLYSNGYLPVVLLGTPEIDARHIDADSLRLGRADCVGALVAPNEGPPGPKVQRADVGTPVSEAPCGCHSDEQDGIPDVTMKFPSAVLEEALRLSTVCEDAPLEVILTGTISQPGSPFDGVTFIAVDCLRLVGRNAKNSPHERHRVHRGRGG